MFARRFNELCLPLSSEVKKKYARLTRFFTEIQANGSYHSLSKTMHLNQAIYYSNAVVKLKFYLHTRNRIPVLYNVTRSPHWATLIVWPRVNKFLKIRFRNWVIFSKNNQQSS